MEITITIKLNDYDLKESEVKKSKKDNEPNVSVYAQFFDEASPFWTNHSEYNLMFLKQQQLYANEKLKKQGYLFLNDVHDQLGIPRTKQGQCVGWVFDEKNSDGDNYISFGIFEDHNGEFINGKKNTALLDFNVDGLILDKI